MADDGLRLEVYSLPHVGTLTKKFDLTKFVEAYTFNDRFNDLSDGTFTIPDDAALPSGVLVKDRLLKIDEANHANDVGAMIRVLRGTTPIMHQIVTRSEDSWSAEESTTKLTSEGLEWLLDRALVPAYDYPADPTEDSDWIYGAESVLSASGLEDTIKSKEIQTLYHTQTSGTGTITYSGQTTSALNFNASWFDVHQALEALSNIQDVVVTGAGTASAPYVIEFLDPAGDVAQVTSSFTGAIITTVTAGGVPDADGWTQSYHPQTGLLHGTYQTFAVTSVQAHTGTYSLLVNNGATTYPTDYGGAQQVISIEGGRTYRAEVWVRPTFTGDFRLVIRTMDETLIALAEGTLTLNTWTKLTIAPFVVPKHVGQIIFRIGNLQSADTGDWYVDDAVLAPGFPAAALGLMMSDVRTAALAAGAPLSWLTPTWTTTLDSDGVPWDSARKWNVNHDQSIYQLIEYARGWNYESRIRWDVADNRFEWDMWNPNGGGQTRANIAITGKSGIERSAPIVRRPPDATYMRVEGDLGAWGEFVSTTLDDVWGRLEKSHRDRQGVNSAELDVLATRLITAKSALTSSRTVTVADPSILPWTAYEPGDIVTLNLAPKDTKQQLRVAAIVASRASGEATPRYDVHFGSPVYSGDAAIAQGLRKLIREFRRPAPSIPAGKTGPDLLVGTGSTPTVVVAASNSTVASKGGAQFRCLGTNDHLVIQQALTWLAGQGVGGRLVLCEGVYNLGGTIVINTSCWIMGMGRSSTTLKMQASANVNGFTLGSTAAGYRITVSHLSLDGNRGQNTVGNGIFGPQACNAELVVNDCEIFDWDNNGIYADRTAGSTIVTDVRVYNNTESGVAVVGDGYHFVSDSLIETNQYGVYVTGSVAHVVDCKIVGNTSHGIWQTGNQVSDHLLISGNQVSSNGGQGIFIADSAFGGLNVVASNNVFSNTSHGIQVAGSSGHNLVVGNVVRNNSGSGICMGISGQTVIGGLVGSNVVVNNGNHGILFDQVHDAAIIGNYVASNSKVTNITYDGIHLFNNSDDVFVSSNKVWDLTGGNGQRYGLNIAAATCNATVYVNNDCRASGRTADYNDIGTASINTYAGGAGPGDNF